MKKTNDDSGTLRKNLQYSKRTGKDARYLDYGLATHRPVPITNYGLDLKLWRRLYNDRAAFPLEAFHEAAERQ